MKTQTLRCSMSLLVVLAFVFSANAQLTGRYHNTDSLSHGVDKVKTNWKDHVYEIMRINNKVTELMVDGKKIPADGMAKYNSIITEIMLQVNKDRVQAKRDQSQAQKDGAQGQKDLEQSRKNKQQTIQ
jgi:colicin import membrane protein